MTNNWRLTFLPEASRARRSIFADRNLFAAHKKNHQRRIWNLRHARTTPRSAYRIKHANQTCCKRFCARGGPGNYEYNIYWFDINYICIPIYVGHWRGRPFLVYIYALLRVYIYKIINNRSCVCVCGCVMAKYRTIKKCHIFLLSALRWSRCPDLCFWTIVFLCAS